MTRRLALPLLLASLGAATLASSKLADLPSVWPTAAVVIDGHDDEWAGAATLLAEAPIAVGVANDDQFLYIRLRTTDRVATMQLVYGGLTLWVDPGGGEKKGFGLKYPVGTKLPEPSRRGRRTGEPGEHGGQGAPRDVPPPRDRTDEDTRAGRSAGRVPPMVDPAKVVPDRVEVFGPGGKDDVRSLVLDHLPGIEVAMARVEDAIVYELKVPLTKTADAPYAIGAAPGAKLGLGLETGKIERPEMEGRPGGGPMGGGRGPGGMGGMMPGGMGGGHGRGGPGGPGGGPGDDLQAMFKQVKIWTRVQLATAR